MVHYKYLIKSYINQLIESISDKLSDKTLQNYIDFVLLHSAF